MVYCPQCALEVNRLFKLVKRKSFLNTFSWDKETIHCCYQCATKIATYYVKKNQYIVLQLSTVKSES